MRLWSKSREILEEYLPKDFAKRHLIIIFNWRRVKKLMWAMTVVFLFSLIPLFAGIWYMYGYNGCILNIGCLNDDNGKPLDLNKLAHSDFKRASYIYADNGQIIGMYFDEIRDPVRINEVPKRIQDAFIAAEDKRFYSHHGVDIMAIASAAMGNTLRSYGLKFWARSGGASTITQQFARLEYASDVNDFKTRARSISRKIKEARLAIQLEKHYPKEKILEGFLNIIWLGHGANGVSAADQRYWGKDIRTDKPTIREAVILAAINKNPALYDPISHEPTEPKINLDTSANTADQLKEEYKAKIKKEGARVALAKDRYNFVLDQMRNNGAISQEEYDKNRFEPDENPNTELAHLKPWKDPSYGYSNRMIKEFLLSEGHTEQELSYHGGLRIYTTIDPKIQKIASEEFEKQLVLLNQGLAGQNRLNGAFTIIEVKTGNILALSGGNSFDESQFNRSLAYRSPGSGIKPFIYAAAIEKGGYNLFTKACNTPFSMRGANGKAWAPKNFEEKSPRPTDCNRDLAEGVIFSLNLETLNIARNITMEPIIALLNDFGIWGNRGIIRDSDGKIWFRRPGYQITGGLVPLLPTAIGASDVSLI